MSATTTGREARARAPRRALGATLGNALSLYASTLVTSGLGFAYWAVAARLTDERSVGAAGAAVAAMQLVGTLATLGLGSLIIANEANGENRSGNGNSPRFAPAALRVTAAAGLIGGVAVGVVLQATSSEPGVSSGWWGPLLFGAGCSLTSFTTVLDLALISRRRASRQLLRNGVFAGVKLALLPLVAVFATLDEVTLYGAWLAGNVASVLVVWTLTGDRRSWLHRPRHAVWAQRWDALGHHVLNVADHCALLALPPLVSAVLGASVNAGFYVALLVAGFCWVVPAHLGTALFAVAAGDRATLRRELREALVVAVGVWLAGLVVAALAGRLVLAGFGPGYAAAWPALVWLVATTLPFTIRGFFGAVCRVEGELSRGATVVAACSLVNVAVAAATVSFGISVMSAALLATGALQAALLWPAVARAAGLPVTGAPMWRWR